MFLNVAKKINYCSSQCAFVWEGGLTCFHGVSREGPPICNLDYESETSIPHCTGTFLLWLCLSWRQCNGVPTAMAAPENGLCLPVWKAKPWGLWLQRSNSATYNSGAPAFPRCCGRKAETHVEFHMGFAVIWGLSIRIKRVVIKISLCTSKKNVLCLVK